MPQLELQKKNQRPPYLYVHLQGKAAVRLWARYQVRELKAAQGFFALPANQFGVELFGARFPNLCDWEQLSAPAGINAFQVQLALPKRPVVVQSLELRVCQRSKGLNGRCVCVCASVRVCNKM